MEEAIKLLQSNDVIYTAVLVSLTRPLSPGRLSIKNYKRPLQTSKNAFNRLIASSIGPYTLHEARDEAVYSAEINTMVFVAGLPIDISSDRQVIVSAKGRLSTLPHLKLVASYTFIYLMCNFNQSVKSLSSP